MEKVRIFDTTLRDGEQSPGCSMSTAEKLVMAKQLARLGVDTIEAGFANSSGEDFESIRMIGQEVEGPMIVSLARARKDDIDRSAEALQGATNWGIHTFIASSPLHMKHKLQMDPGEVLKAAVKAVEHAKQYTSNVEFSAEDASRSEPTFLVELFSAAVKAGATILNIPDTVGYTMPDEIYQLVARLKNEVYQSDQVMFSVHCHNDLGMAVANSLAALRAGARQVECTVNGIGERAGNAALEEIVMSLATRQQYYNLTCNVIGEQIYPSSRLLSQITGASVQPNKAIVGANAFAHEAGIHQDGVLKNALTYEIMTPQSVGIQENNLVLGKHSGRHALANRLESRGFYLNEEELNEVFEKFKHLADRKKQIFDEDLDVIVTQGVRQQQDDYILDSLTVSSGTHMIPTATVGMIIHGERIKKAAFGDGPVDAALNTIKEITNIDCRLIAYSVKSITGGTDAQGKVSVTIEKDGMRITGRGADTDIVTASALAFINSINRLSRMP
ncbi:MAG: 2-isopropylmalate synthase [SAR324 cluster bacterium]|nr:2-isopropylmalate synthase [SAR324 cluster bacterium]